MSDAERAFRVSASDADEGISSVGGTAGGSELGDVPSAGLVPIRRALLSVSNKSSLPELATFLHAMGVEIISTGGSAKMIADGGIPVTEVSELTGFPEMMDGRVKTLHPRIHGGLLAIRGNDDHERAMDEQGILPIDLLVVNLYPFEETSASGASFEECVENIDVGGPAMIRAASKNFAHVTVVTSVDQYPELMTAMEDNGGSTTLELRRKLALMAYALTSAYDASISTWFSKQEGGLFPQRLALGATLKQSLRYGENPHQVAAFYTTDAAATRLGVGNAEVIQGKELSYNNIADADAAFRLASEFEEPVCAIIKHSNPCGTAVGVSTQDAYLRALAADPVSAFGGIIALNKTIDLPVAEEIVKLFTEVVVAPDATAEALAVLATRKSLRVMLTGVMASSDSSPELQFKSVSGGLLVQSSDEGIIEESDLTVVTERAPTAAEMRDLLFAWKVCKHVKSNAIVYAKGGATVGIGAGQMSRVDSARIAAWKAEETSREAQEETCRSQGSVCASDAFFPFADGLIVVAEAGATAVIQPGGSKRDEEVIAAANERGIAMVFTGMRHFLH